MITFSKYFFLFIILNLFQNLSFSQHSKIDSFLSVLNSEKTDTNKVILLNRLCDEYRKIGEYATGLQYGNKSLELGKKINFSKGIASSYSSMGVVYRNQGNYDMALENYFAALKIREEIGDKDGISTSYNNIGIVYYNQGNYDKALENLLASLKLRVEIGDKEDIASSYNNIGLIYKEQGNYNKALENLFASLKIKQEIGQTSDEAYGNTYNNLGYIYRDQAIQSGVNDSSLFNKALENHFTSLQIREEIQDKQGIAMSCNNIGFLYTDLKRYEKAIEWSNKGLLLAKEIGSKEDIKESYQILSVIYGEMSNYKNAYEYHQLYSQIKDTLFNEESSNQIAEMSTKYETEKKEQQISLLNKDKELQDAQLNRQKIIIWSVAGGLLVVLILSIFIFRERRKSEKLLLNILPVETARELKRNGKAKAKHYESVTVMFTDFKGFTSIAEKLSAEELVSELDFLFKKFDEIISKYNIEKIKTIGDAYMCASGLPTPNLNHAEEIVKAGVEIQNWMKEQNGKWSLRMGIHSGPVTAGVVGDKKFAYDIWGDTVNTASRMESSGEPGKINISGATHVLIKDKFASSFRGKIPAKNKGEIDMYFVEKINIDL